jgi:hypothetical protein
MSRTTLCLLTAAGLVAVSVSLMIVRRHAMGGEVPGPAGPGTWKVTLVVQGECQGDARLQTATPLDYGRQHVLREVCHSTELIDKPPEARHPERRQVMWSKRGGAGDGPFRAHYEFICALDLHKQTSSMSRGSRSADAPPGPGEHLDVTTRTPAEREGLSDLARRTTANVENPRDQAEALYRFVDQEIANEPSIGGPATSAAECLKNQSGDCGAKSRLLAALLRHRGIPARLVTGLTLTKGTDQLAHYWVEAWVDEHWLPMCAFYHHFGKVPPTYLVFSHDDIQVVRGRNIRDLDHAFLVERVSPEGAIAATGTTPLRHWFLLLSLYMLPPAEQRLVEYLLLLPVAALVVCIYRNVIGLGSFGTFAPALVGLAFRDLHSLPGILVFVSIVLIGWVIRRVLDKYHLLQVPRTAFLLSMVMILLITAIVTANLRDLPATRYISVFPLVILTGMIERFWTLETEDSTTASFKTLLSTLGIAATIALFLSLRAVVNHLFRYPETLGLVMAGQLLIGRYTGYRLTELYRFRDFLRQQERVDLMPWNAARE